MQGGEFVAFLPGDNHDLASSSTHAVIEIINEGLSQLLRLPPQQFWQVVLSDKSLHLSLDSFLRFRRRCYDDSVESIQGSSDLLLQLSQRAFRVFWRMAHPQEEQQQAAAAAVAGSSKQQRQQQQVPSPAQVAEHLYNNHLIDVPKMLDIAVLYGPGNSKLTGQLLQQLLVLQPKYAKDIMLLAEPLSGNLYELAENVKRLADRLLQGKTSTAAEGQQLRIELAEAVKYFIDAFLTLQALVDCLPQAAALLLHPDHHGSVLLAVAVVHGTLLPVLQRVSQQPEAAMVQGLHPARILQLQQCAVSLVSHMLQAAFCTAAGTAAASAVAVHGDASPGNSSSSKAADGLVGLQQLQPGLNAELQGQELMNLLMLLAHPSDQLYGGGSNSIETSAKGGLLAAVNHTHHLDVAVAAAVEQGLLSLDDAQFDYLLALVDGDRDLLQQRSQQHKHSQQQTPSSTITAAASPSSSSQLPADLSDRIRSIKELLPDYGDGFLTAVLYHSGWNAEQAINCLLEGSLPPQVQGLDNTLKTWNPPGSTSSQGPSNTAEAEAGSSGGNSMSWTGLAREAAAAAAAAPPVTAPIPLPSLEQAAAAGPKPQIDRRTGRILGALPSHVRSVTKNMAYELQYEYDDEYDDSFDDLIGPGNDGVCDIEGEDSTADAHGGLRPARTGATRPSPAAAADIYADEPGSSSRGPQQQRQQQRGRQQREGKLWVLDGKVYNYKKEGAVEVAGQAGAQKALQAAQQAAQAIHGLGPGGNVPLAVDRRQQDNSSDKRGPELDRSRGAAAAAAALGGSGVRTGTGQRGGGRGGRGRGDTAAGTITDGASSSAAGGRGRGQGGYQHKEQHKSAVANHHRKDRAMSKQAKGMF